MFSQKKEELNGQRLEKKNPKSIPLRTLSLMCLIQTDI